MTTIATYAVARSGSSRLRTNARWSSLESASVRSFWRPPGGSRTTASPRSTTVTRPPSVSPQRRRTPAGTDIWPLLETRNSVVAATSILRLLGESPFYQARWRSRVLPGPTTNKGGPQMATLDTHPPRMRTISSICRAVFSGPSLYGESARVDGDRTDRPATYRLPWPSPNVLVDVPMSRTRPALNRRLRGVRTRHRRSRRRKTSSHAELVSVVVIATTGSGRVFCAPVAAGPNSARTVPCHLGPTLTLPLVAYEYEGERQPAGRRCGFS